MTELGDFPMKLTFNSSGYGYARGDRRFIAAAKRALYKVS